MYKYILQLNKLIRSIASNKFEIYKSYCSCCDEDSYKIAFGPSAIEHRCIGCKSTLLSINFVKYLKSLNLDSSIRVYELSYHGAVFNYLEKYFKNFTFSEFFDNSPLGKYINGVRNEDIQNLTFQSNYFDLITCTEVMEHVPNYKKGFVNVCRVLKENGIFIFTVPLYEDDKTIEVAVIESGKIIWKGNPEYHDSRVTGPYSVPVFWRHSKKMILVDLINAGFSNAEIVKVENLRSTFSEIIVAKK